MERSLDHMNKKENIPNSYREAKRIIQEAKDADQLVLFIGAGVSINSGMPSWKDAVQHIGNLLGLDKIENSDYLKIPQYYYNSHGKQAYNTLMREIFKDGIKLPVSDIHRKVLRFNARSIITTNYDDLIERASEEYGEIRQIISQDKDIPYRKYNKELIKMHGDFAHDNFVLKEVNYSENFKLIENYIKSIIGSKVLLFIGYSFNDPDLKQIFNWVKNIVGENMRYSYLLNADRVYDENEKSYYENLGVKIIYASKLNQDSFNVNNISKNLNNVLDYFLLPDRTSNLIDDIYIELKKYSYFSYITIKHLNNVLWKRGFYIADNLILSANNTNDKAQETLNLLCSNLDDIQDPIEKQKVKTILDILHKSMIKGIKSDKRSVKFETFMKKEDIEEDVYTFNWQRLNKLKNKNEILLGKNSGEVLLQQASIAYYLGDLLSSYNYLKQAGLALFEEKSYGLYYISQFNRKWLGKIITEASYMFDIDEFVVESIKNEISNIDFNNISDNINEISNRVSLIRDIDHWSYSYTIFQDLYDLNLKTSEQANTDYMFFQGVPGYEQAQIKAKDLYNFVFKNYLLLDQYRDINDNYKLYIRTVLFSVASDDKKDSFDPVIHTGNIKKEYLDDFDLFLILKYSSSSKSIYELFEEYQCQPFLNLNKKGSTYLESIIPNIVASHYKENIRNDLYWKLIALCGFVELNSEIVNKILDSINNYLIYPDIVTNQNIIRQFLINIKSQKLISNQNIAKIKKIIAKNINLMIENKLATISERVYFLNEYVKSIDETYNNVSIVEEAIKNNMDEVIISLYGLANNSVRNKIKDYFKNKEFNNEYDRFRIKLCLAIFNIINLDEEEKNSLINYLRSKDISAFQVKELPNKVKEITHLLTRLCIVRSKYTSENVRDVIKRYGMPADQWLINYQNFDYNNFELDWLKECEVNILENISSDKDIKNKIKSKLIQAFRENKLSPDLETIYFNYFA